MRFAYADPPYPRQAKRWYGSHPDYAGEVETMSTLLERGVGGAGFSSWWAGPVPSGFGSGVKERYDEEGSGGLLLRFHARTLRPMWSRMSAERLVLLASQARPYSRQSSGSTRMASRFVPRTVATATSFCLDTLSYIGLAASRH